jgi:hypothetical protein
VRAGRGREPRAGGGMDGRARRRRHGWAGAPAEEGMAGERAAAARGRRLVVAVWPAGHPSPAPPSADGVGEAAPAEVPVGWGREREGAVGRERAEDDEWAPRVVVGMKEVDEG